MTLTHARPSRAAGASARDLGFDRVVAFARDLIRIPSLSGEEGDMAERVVRELEELGFDDVWTDAIGNVIGRVRGEQRSPSLMLCSHLDAVDVGDRAGWDFDPYGGDIVDGHLLGRGAMDVKGPLAVQVYAAAHGLESPPLADVYVAFTVLEERGGGGMAYLMRHGDIRPDLVILGEATGGDVCVGHRGHAELEIDVCGRAAHASTPERGVNPIRLVPMVVAALEEFVQTLPADAVLGMPTVTPTMLETVPRGGNVIPEIVRITVDCRIMPGQSDAWLLEKLSGYLADRVPPGETGLVSVRCGVDVERAYTGLELRRTRLTPGYLLVSTERAVQVACETVAVATGRRPAVRPWQFGTDGGHSCGTHGIPTIGYAPGDEALAHSNRERLELAAARQVYGVYPQLMRALQRA